MGIFLLLTLLYIVLRGAPSIYMREPDSVRHRCLRMQPVLAQPALMTMGQHSGLLLFDLVYLSEFSRETEATEYIERSFL